MTLTGLQALDSQLPYAGESLSSPPARPCSKRNSLYSVLARRTLPWLKHCASVKRVRSARGEDINMSLSKPEEPKVRKALLGEEKNG